jgi:hypothetical protein
VRSGISAASTNAGVYSAATNGLHTVCLTIVSGTPNINYFNIVNTTVPTITPQQKIGTTMFDGGKRCVVVLDGISRSTLKLHFSKPAQCRIDFFNLSGRKILSRYVAGTPGTLVVPLPSMPAGASLYSIEAPK